MTNRLMLSIFSVLLLPSLFFLIGLIATYSEASPVSDIYVGLGCIAIPFLGLLMMRIFNILIYGKWVVEEG